MLSAPQRFLPRAVPLGGIRALEVRRTLPQRQRTLIGAFCFVDHYGPTRVTSSGGMAVPRHPHIGLQTVSWLFRGAIDHTDSAGHVQRVVPGEVNLMTAGRGITHSEFSTGDTRDLHGVQFWIALPDQHRHTQPGLHHHRPSVVCGPRAPSERDASPAWYARVALGSFAGEQSPIPLYSDGVLVELNIAPKCTVTLDATVGIRTDFEYGVLVDTGNICVNGEWFHTTELAYLAPGTERVTLTGGAFGVRVLLFGGVPLNEKIVMWWNFVGRSHEDIVTAHAQYTAEISGSPAAHEPERFGPFPAHTPPALPAPPLPHARLLAR